MKKLKLWLVISLVFIAGFVGGVVVTRAVVHHVVSVALANPDHVRAMIERHVASRLKLDAGQRAKFHDILADTETELKDLRRETAPRFFGIVSNAESRISVLLTPEQKERFEKMKAEHHRLFRSPSPPSQDHHQPDSH